MGQNLGQLISKLAANIWDIDIKNLAVSHLKHTACSSCLLMAPLSLCSVTLGQTIANCNINISIIFSYEFNVTAK